MVKKTQDGYHVFSQKGKNLGGPYKTREEALKRLRDVEFLKHHRNANASIYPGLFAKLAEDCPPVRLELRF